jgi:2-polyprenyl-6-methoxyphenol hydroxylase-like FAD-dependent oxidoreductase
MRVIVAGAGIGGLSAAAALRRAGIEATVFDQVDELGKTLVGGGFHLWVNAIRALREIGLDEAAHDAGAPLTRTEFCSSRGRSIAHWSLTEIADSLGAFDVGIARQDLVSLLYGAIDQEHVTPSAKLVDFVEDGTGVTARFADGREERGDVLVGADGLRSVIRAKLLGDAEPDYAGYVQWQTLLDGGAEMFPAGVERITFGPGSRTVMHRVTGGRLFWACVLYGPAAGGGRPEGRKAKLLDYFSSWPDPIPAAIEATPEEQISGLPIYDRKPVDRWGTARVTLAGDAAHPMTTNTSQGGNQAIEDGVLLARLLGGASDPGPALRAYEQRRIERTTPLVKGSRWVANWNAWDDPLRVAFRDRFYQIGMPRKGLSDLRKAVATPL